MEVAVEWLELERDVLGQRPLISGSVEYVRAAYDATSKQLAEIYPPPEAYDVTDERMETDQGVPLRVYFPTKAVGDKLPVGVFAHGGGHVNGGAWRSSFEDKMCRYVAHNAQVVIAQVDFRLAPEHPVPAQVDDCYAAYNWCFENAQKLKGDTDRFFSFGSSFGGGVAVGVALKLIDNVPDRVKGVVALAPALVHPENVPEEFRSMHKSYKENWSDVPVQDGQSVALFYEHSGASLHKDDIYAFPCMHKNLKNLPPTYQAVCGLDPVRDDALILQHVLNESRVPNKLDLYEKLPHYFWLWPQLKSSDKFHRGVAEGVKWVVEQMEKSG